MHVFYLHGFASSARSKKGAYLNERFAAHGIAIRCPDFNEPDFSTLTMTRMLAQVAQEIETLSSQPIVLVGSSLGAVVAIHTAARMPDRIDRVVLLAPAVMFPRDAHRVLGEGAVARWQTSGVLDVFHFGYGEKRSLNYAFYEDSLQYDVASADILQPTRIFQGRRDESVLYRDVERYAASRPRSTLTLLDDDHQLMASLPRIWSDMVEFLELT